MREQIIKVAQENGINVIEMKVKLNDVMQADEIFFCNSLIGVWPVRLLDDHVFKSKKMTQKLVELLRKKQHGIENVA
jgi:4-amino-4-deoxychorismate lyase